MVKRGINLLDDLQIRRLVSKAEPIAISDGAGLTFTLSKAGTATWVLRYRAQGRSRELTIGNYPDISLAAARRAARERRVEVDNGIDPAAVKKASKAAAAADWTVRTLATHALEKVLVEPSYSKGTVYYRTQDIRKIIVPRLGAMRVNQVTSTNIVQMLEAAGKTWTITKRILTSASKLLDVAVGIQIISTNPCATINLTALRGPRPPVKKRTMLTEMEMQAVLGQVHTLGDDNALAFKILLATCVRSNELAQARWEDVDLIKKTWWVPDHVVKTRNGFRVPLADPVVGWFTDLKLLAGGSGWVLPARSVQRHTSAGGDGHVGATTLWAAINRTFIRGGFESRRFTPHDTRSTAKGHMRNMGVSREVSELVLNHSTKGMEVIYDVRDEIPERRAAMNIWADFVTRCSNQKAGSPPPDEEPNP